MSAQKVQPVDAIQLVNLLGSRLLLRDADGYEAARQNAVWRGNKPKRYPEAIVTAESDKDVIAAVKLAKARGWQITVRSRGHSWSASHLRDGALLVDLSQIDQIEYNPADQTVIVGPSVKGRVLNRELAKYGRMFPGGHHESVGIGGFVLAGGFGWNCRQLGNGCQQILEFDMVTPDGELIHVDDTHHTDYMWAVRGSGPGFFGAVTRFRMKTYPIPKVMRRTGYVFDVKDVGPLVAWAASVAKKVPRALEMFISSFKDEKGTRAILTGIAFTESEQEALEALAITNTCPILDRAIKKSVAVPFTLEQGYDAATSSDPAGKRFAVDNMYIDASPEVIAERIPRLFLTLPTNDSHIYWLNWGPCQPLPDMALSVQADIFLAAYSLWDNEADDEAMGRWPVDFFKSVDDISAGAQMNDENLRDHPARYLSEEAEKRLEELRAKYDPEQLFASYLRSGRS
jgi:FAD/FMN-containing dehydrogenase